MWAHEGLQTWPHKNLNGSVGPININNSNHIESEFSPAYPDKQP